MARHTSSKDSITMNLEKSAASFSESDSEKFRLVFLFEDAIYAVYFSLAMGSSTHHGVQLVLGMNQGGNPFALVETGDTRPVYMTWPADWSDRALSDRPSDQVGAKVICCKPLTTLSPDQWQLNHQGSVLGPYGLPPTANRWPHCGGLTSRRFLQPQPTGRGWIVIMNLFQQWISL